MDALDLVMIGITVWVVLSGPVALLIGQVLRRRSEQLPMVPVAEPTPERTLLTAAR